MDRELQKILEELQKEFGKFNKILGSTNKTIIKRTKSEKEESEAKKRAKLTMYDYIKAQQAGKELTVEFAEELKEATQELGFFEKKLQGMPSPMNLLKKGFDVLKDIVVGTTLALVDTAIAFGKTSSNIKTLGEATEAGAGNLGKFGTFLNKIAGEVDDNIQMFKGLAQSGATFNSSIEQMRNSAKEAGMPLVQFQELVENNTVTLAKMFGSVNAGIPEFVKLGKGLRAFTETDLAGFGITMTEANEFLATFTELQRARGMSERMNAETLLEGTKVYVKQLTTLSRLTGQSVTELDAQMKQDALDGVLQAKLAQMSEEDAQNFQAILRQFPAEARGAVMELGLLKAPISDAAVGLQSFSGGAVQELIQSAMKAGKMTDDEAIELANKIRATGNSLLKNGNAAADAVLAGGLPMGKAYLDIAAAMAGGEVDRAVFDKATLEAQKGVTNELVNTQSTLEKNTVSLQSLGTTMMAQLLLDSKSKGAQVLRAFNEDGGNTTAEMVASMERIFGLTNDDDKKNSAKDTDRLIPAQSDMGEGGAQYGTKGFRDFGSGTPMTLHGSEMVLPKNNVGELAKELAVLGSPVTKTTEQSTVTNNSTTAIDMTTMNKNTLELIELNKKVAQHLNTLVTIGAMTEKNTKSTNNSLANMGGSLV